MNLKEYVNQNAQGAFNIDKGQMPQIDDLEAFAKYVRYHNIPVEFTTVNLSWLKPTQQNYDLDKARENDSPKPIVVDEDYYVLDGHHRFFHKQLNRDRTTDILHVLTPLNKLIALAYDFNE